MSTETCVELGVIQRKQGLKGEIVAWLNHEVPQLDTLKTLFIQVDHTLVPYGIEYLSLKHCKATIKLKGVDGPTRAHDLKGRAIFVLREELPQLSSTEVLPDQLMGYYVEDAAAGSLGKVQGIYTPPSQKLLAVAYQEKELLIPYHTDIVVAIDHSQKTITVQLPKGFIEAAF